MEEKLIKLMKTLDITRDEAIELLEFDEGKTDNMEVKKIEEKEKKKTKKKKGETLAKVKTQKAKKKTDKNKEQIMTLINKLIDENIEVFINPQIMTASKMTFTDKDNNYYSISITKHKTKPDGYHEE